MPSIFQKIKRGTLLSYLVVVPLSAFASIAFAMALQPVIDTGLSGDGAAFFRASFWALLMVFVSTLASYLEQVLRAKLLAQCTCRLRLQYFSRFFLLPFERFFAQDTAAYLSKLTTDAQEVSEKYCGSALNIYRAIWNLTVSISAIASARWELALCVVVFSLLSVNLPKLFQDRTRAAEETYLANCDSHLAQAQESIRNYLLIRLHDLLPSQTEKYGETAQEVERSDVIRKKKILSLDSLVGIITSLCYVCIIIACMFLVLRGRLSVGYTMSVSQLLGGIMFPFEMLPGYLLAYRTGRGIYQDNEAQFPTAAPALGERQIPETSDENGILLDKVSFSYREGSPLLKGIDLPLDLGKKYALVGASGSGKSTMAKLVTGFLSPDTGRIVICGVPLEEAERSSLYRLLTYQSQSVSFFRDTVRNNILLGREISDEAWETILRQAQLRELLDRLPEGADTVVEEDGKNFSGGEAQRIGLARCLAAQTKFLILDEITAALDSQTAIGIEDVILSLSGVGVLMITHRVNESVMRRYDRIFFLENGEVAEQGSWEELMALQGGFYRLASAAHRNISEEPEIISGEC